MSVNDSPDTLLDCLVIGAGPAGLTAATYLARYRRTVTVIDGGRSRARWIPASHNCPGFPFGVAGDELLARFRAHAQEFHAAIVATQIRTLRRDGSGFVADDGGREFRARHVILATGVVDRLPAFDGLEPAIASGVLRLCAVCDAYEARDDAIAVLGPGAVAVDHARFLRTFSRRVTVLDSNGIGPGDADLRQRAEAAGIALRGAPTSLGLCDGRCHVVFGDGSTECFDTLYPVLGADAQSALAQSMETTMEANGELRVDVHMQTSVDGLYAVGDVVSGLNQISVAVGQAALAATAIHQRLPSNPC